MKALAMDLLHQCIVHPILFFSRDAKWAQRLHDATEPYPAARIASPAASLEVEALDAKLVEIQKLCRNDELDFDPRSGIDRLAADARAVLRRSGR